MQASIIIVLRMQNSLNFLNIQVKTRSLHSQKTELYSILIRSQRPIHAGHGSEHGVVISYSAMVIIQILSQRDRL